MRAPFAFAILIGATALAASAAAQPVPTTRSASASYADLDLGTAAGRRTLEGRISAAVRQVCGSSLSASTNGLFQRRRCVREAFASARPQVELAIAGRSGLTRIAMRGE